MQDEKKNLMGSIIEVLCKDRGSTNTKKILQKIPDKFIEIVGFLIPVFMMSSLIVEQILRAFFHESIMEQAFFVIGAFAEIFAILYISRSFMVGEKQGIKEFIKTHIWDILLVFMLIMATISTFNSEDVHKALWGVMIRHDGLLAYYIYASVYVCVKSVKSARLRMWLLRAISILICILSINTLLQAIPGMLSKLGMVGFNMCRYAIFSSIYFNINHFEYILILGLMASGTLVVIENKKILKFLWLLIFGFELWGLIINNTFAGFVAVVIGTVFMAIVMLINDKKHLISIILVVVTLITVSVITDYNYYGILRRNILVSYNDVKTIETNDRGGSGRIGLWKGNIGLIKKKPLLGYGPEGTYNMYARGETKHERPHNEYLQHALYMGIPAGIAYILALFTLFITMIKKIKYLPKELIAMGVVVFAYCVSAFFGNTLYNTVPYFFMFLGGISVCGMIKKEENKSNIEE
ncbi:MAG: O-antigen ligase family protein [Lachnospiraceae bacterium]|nr:O-antigen ligase family protein [Lachnospiraceae bacterium]